MDKIKKVLGDEDYPIMEILQLVLKYFRLTQEELGEKLGVSSSTISLWSRGKVCPSAWTESFIRKDIGRLTLGYLSGHPIEITLESE